MIMFEFECELFFSSLHYVTVGRNLEFICTCFFSSSFIAWDQASQWGKKENTGYLSAPFARRFFSFLLQCGAWSRATFFVRMIRTVIRICAISS